MLIASQRDFWSGVLFVTVGFLCAGSTLLLYKLGSAADPGPGYFPFGLGLLLTLLGSVVLLRSLRHPRVDTEVVGSVAWRPLIVISSAVLMFGLLLPRLGLSTALPVLVILSSLATEEFHWKEVLLNAVALTALCFGIFIWGLNLTLPR
jgi:hypothetical protein